MIPLRRLFATILLTAATAPAGLIEPFTPDAQGFQEKEGVVEIDRPMSLRLRLPSPRPPQPLVLEWESFCIGGVRSFAALPGPPFEAGTARYLEPIPHSETWSPWKSRIDLPGQPLSPQAESVRLDLPLPPGGRLQIRNPRWRPLRDDESFTPAAPQPSHEAYRQALDSYLSRSFPHRIDEVEITDRNTVIIRGTFHRPLPPSLALAEIPMDLPHGDPRSFERIEKIPSIAKDGSFTITLPRLHDRHGHPHDRLLSRWQLIGRTDAKAPWQPLSHARYADRLPARTPALPHAEPRHKKGLGGWHHGRIEGELKDLDISAVTVNVMIHTLASLTPEENTVPFTWQGRTYHARIAELERLDRTFLEAHRHGAMVSAILLVANPAKTQDPGVRRLGHPDATTDGTFAMPNVLDEEGAAFYGAILHLMAERWSRPDARYGRVHHWIMHNEVDAGWVWTNAGEKDALTFMDLYQRSMRMMQLIALQYDPHARTFITLTHHWADHGHARWYGSRRMLELLVRFTRAEGDFPWALAYHPYPQNLFNPRTWEDDQATFSFDSPKITPKNIEVLDAWMKRPEMLFKGEVRPVHLSENGFNSKDYSPASLADQAAGMAYAWKKIRRLSSIESWQYHNWIDNRHEGGLRIGLRKFPDEPGDPLGKKPIWHLYQALATPKEDELCAPCLSTIGLSSWEEALHRDPIR